MKFFYYIFFAQLVVTGLIALLLALTGPATATAREDVGLATTQGELTSNDNVRDGSYVDTYTFTVDETTTMVITMTSESLDPYLYLETEDGTLIAQDDDSGGSFSFDAQIRRELEPGSYRVLATTFASGSTGPYTLRIRESTPLQAGSVLGVPAEIGGELTSDDPQRNGSYFDLYTLSLDERMTVVITMRPTAQSPDSGPFGLDPYLYLEAEDGTPIARDDDGGGGYDAQIRQTLEPGNYRILASTFSFDATGSYTLEIQ